MTQEPIQPPVRSRVQPLLAVVDTNVFPRRAWMDPIIKAVTGGTLVAIWSPLIISEVNRLLTWLWIRRHGGDLSESSRRRCSVDFKKWYESLAVHFRVIEDRPPLEAMWTNEPRDPSDAPIWTAAVRLHRLYPASCVLVITDNLKDGPPPDSRGLQLHENVLYIHPEQATRAMTAWTALMTTGELPETDEPVTEPDQRPDRRHPADARSIDLSSGPLRAILETLSSAPGQTEEATDRL